MNHTNKYFIIGNNIQLPAVGFGTYLISSNDAVNAISEAISVGYRHIDTASVYQNEEGVGRGIAQGVRLNNLHREDLFITTKLWPGYVGWGETPKSLKESKNEFYSSLDKLNVDYIDLYLIHSPHGEKSRLEQWQALLELKAEGLVRSIGVSNFSIEHLEEIKQSGFPLPDVNQIELHPWSQKKSLIEFMSENRIFPIAYSSLAPLSSWRTGEGQESAKTADMKDHDNVFASLAEKYQITEAQLLLKWGNQKGYAILPKSMNRNRMQQNLDLFDFSIDSSDMDILSKLDRGDGIAWSIGDPTNIR